MQLQKYRINIIDNFLVIKLYKRDPDFEMIENINLNVNVNQEKKNIINIKQRELVVIFIFNLIRKNFKMETLFTNLKKMNPILITMIIF